MLRPLDFIPLKHVVVRLRQYMDADKYCAMVKRMWHMTEPDMDKLVGEILAPKKASDVGAGPRLTDCEKVKGRDCA